MMPFHSLFPVLAPRETRCIHLGPPPDAQSQLPADEYAFVEFYCDEPDCDCRLVSLQVIAKGAPDRVFASIEYGWEKESFYRKRTPCDLDAPRQFTRGMLDPMNEQSEFAEDFLDLFKRVVLDEPYRMRLRRHYRMFKEELARRRRVGETGANP